MTVPRFEFEGRQRTVTEIHAMVPAFSRTRIAELLKQGMTTKREMLCRPGSAHTKGGWRNNGCKMNYRSEA